MITREEWEKKLNDVKIRKEDMNKLVMNFLVTEGYVEIGDTYEGKSIILNLFCNRKVYIAYP